MTSRVSNKLRNQNYLGRYGRENATPTVTKNIPDDQRVIPVEDREIKNGNLSWSIVASSGRTSFNCTEPKPVRPGVISCSLQIVGDFWERDRDLSIANITQDFDVLIPQALFDLDALEELRHSLVQWPDHQSREFTCEIGAKPMDGDQRFTFSIGHDERLICTPTKPACALAYICGPSMNAKWSFVVDQSCIRSCAESLTEFLGAMSGIR